MSGIDRPWQRIIRKIFLKFSCVATGLHAAQCRFQYEKLRFFFNMRRVGIFYDFFSSINVIVYKLLFLFSQHPKWFIYDLKKCGLLRRFSPPEARWKELKSFFLCDIVSLLSYIPQVRFGSRIWLRLRKSLKVGQTTTLCPAQDYVFHIFRKVLCLFVAGFSLDCNQGLCFHFPRFTIWNRQDWMFRKIRNSNVNADKFELRYKAVGRQNVARESMFNRKHYALIQLFFNVLNNSNTFGTFRVLF